MAEEKLATEPQVATATAERPILDNPKQALDESAEALIEYGGFELLESSVAGAKVMNPDSKARKNIFLNESSKKKGPPRTQGTTQTLARPAQRHRRRVGHD